MNILSSTVSYHPDSFAPVITLTLEVPLLAMNELGVIVGEQEQAMIIGTEFVAAWKRRNSYDVGSDVYGLLIVPTGTLGMDMGGGCAEKNNVAATPEAKP